VQQLILPSMWRGHMQRSLALWHATAGCWQVASCTLLQVLFLHASWPVCYILWQCLRGACIADQYCHANRGLSAGRLCRYGFIVYKTREAAEQAVAELPGKELDGFPGRKVNVRGTRLHGMHMAS
jgi:hypothetical protein